MIMWNAAKIYKLVVNVTVLRGAVSILGALVLWELGRRLQVPFFAAVPAPSEVVVALGKVIGSGKFWNDWAASYSRSPRRVLCGANHWSSAWPCNGYESNVLPFCLFSA